MITRHTRKPPTRTCVCSEHFLNLCSVCAKGPLISSKSLLTRYQRDFCHKLASKIGHFFITFRTICMQFSIALIGSFFWQGSYFFVARTYTKTLLAFQCHMLRAHHHTRYWLAKFLKSSASLPLNYILNALLLPRRVVGLHFGAKSSPSFFHCFKYSESLTTILRLSCVKMVLEQIKKHQYLFEISSGFLRS